MKIKTIILALLTFVVPMVWALLISKILLETGALHADERAVYRMLDNAVATFYPLSSSILIISGYVLPIAVYFASFFMSGYFLTKEFSKEKK